MSVLLADAPADIEPCEITGGERSHGHAELSECPVHILYTCSFFDEELGFAAVKTKHPIANETPAVANQHSDFADRFRELQASSNHLFGSGLTTHNLEQSHDIRRAEKMSTYHVFRARRRGSNLIDA